MKSNFRLQHSALVLALAAVYPLVGHGAAGTTQFIAGDVTMRRGSAAATPLAKGTVLESGDAIVTGSRGIAQVKFSDGGYVAIQPNSQFDITRYADRGDAAQDSFLVNLARGGMRAITGLIGKRNTANYKVTTSTATVGIRGSSFHMAYNPDGSLSVSTEQDEIVVCTTAGCVSLTAGESALVPSDNVLPSRTNARTAMPLAPFRQDPEVAGNQVNSDGTAAIIPSVPVVQSGVAFVAAGISEGYYNYWQSANGALTSQAGSPQSYLTQGNDVFEPTADASTTVHYTSGAYGTEEFITLASWSSANYSYGEGMYSTAPLAFVAGIPTSGTNLAQLSGLSATYSLAGKSPIYMANGGTGTLLDSSSLNVNFTNFSGSMNLDVSLPYGGSSQGYYMTGTLYSGEGGPASFSSSVSGSGAWADVNGFFSGSSAQHAGVAYTGYGNSAGYFAGAAVFARGAFSGAPVTLTGYALTAGGIDTDYYEGARIYNSNVSILVDSADHTNISAFDDGNVFSRDGSMTVNRAIDLGSDGKLVLGTWSAGGWDYGEGYFEPISFVVGKPTSDTAISSLGSATATYTLASASDASAVHFNDGSIGTLTAAALQVNFNSGYSAATMTMDINSSYGGGTDYHLVGTNINGTGKSFEGSLTNQGGDTASAYVEGYFYGSSAQYAGIGYSGSTDNNEFGGAAILTGGGFNLIPPTPGTYSNLASMAIWSNLVGVPVQISGNHTFANDGGGNYLQAASESGNTFSGAVHDTFDSTATGGNSWIGWGRWSSVSTSFAAAPSDTVHYIVGSNPTPSSYIISETGTLSYTMSGRTDPTTSDGSNVSFGSATLSVNFGSLPTADVTVATSLASTTANGMAIGNNATFSTGSGAQHMVSGFLSGPTAGHAGIVYSLDAGSGVKVNGAVGFQKLNPL